MTIEIGLLKALSNKQNFMQFKHFLNAKTMSVESLTLIQDYAVYFNDYPLHDVIEWEIFSTFFFSVRHPYYDEKSVLLYKASITRISEADDGDIRTLLKGFQQQEFYEELRDLIEKNVDSNTIKAKIDAFEERLGLVDKDLCLETPMDLEQALEATDRTGGLLFRCDKLRDHFQGGLIKGDFIILAGFTDSGKTSFCASELSHMAQQIQDDKYILWLNNEGAWQRILPRIYCATLNTTHTELTKRKAAAILEYKKRMRGNSERIKILDIQGKSIKDVERFLKKYPPALIVLDMLDHLRGFENYMSGEDGSVGRYKQLYQWAREISSEYCPVIATSQLNRIDYELNNVYPSLTNLEGSGVVKQAAATAVIMIGMQQGNNHIRYLSTPKFKNGSNKGWRAEVKFDSMRSRFI